MSMTINGLTVMDSWDIWMVTRKSSSEDDTVTIAFPDEDQARLDQGVYGGQLKVSRAFATEPVDVEPGDIEDLRV
jgi:hypothetical protein